MAVHVNYAPAICFLTHMLVLDGPVTLNTKPGRMMKVCISAVVADDLDCRIGRGALSKVMLAISLQWKTSHTSTR